ncbi:RagB/SusD family nutrient uptake outer membrane protein [uncultured Bacteroides sp.]|uniref:RagB/SusD family nutrient uptake outer membrane protein n=1 Tax=uncultured Bacteroides sp. TaxID=162156 RepID=UPI002617CF6F|nr:RagB/SusD family nutrient uptake outer membrane protein [uncultured Bacteroides sp.]
MKRYIQLFTLGAFLVGGFTSCNDFLDREPLDKVTPENFFSSEEELAAYAINNYNFETVDGSYGLNFFGKDNDTDNQVSGGNNSFWVPGNKKVPSDEGYWSSSSSKQWSWRNIRSCNYFFEQVLPRYEAGSILGNHDNVKHYIGEMYVIRAYNYYKMLLRYGDLPIVEVPLPDIQEDLVAASERQPRNKVARFIIEDLKRAQELLLDKSPDGKKNRISKNVAYLLHARVALFEATWEKYHRGTAFVPGGTGWPGKDSQGYNADTEINYFLDEAMSASKVVGDQMVDVLAENTDTPEGMNASLESINPYYTMFCDEDMSGYDEVLLWKQFSVEMNVTNNLQMELERNGAGSGWTRGMVNSFLMRNGLPIYASGSGYDPNWEVEGVNKTLTDRDSRIVIFTKKPGDINYYNNDGTSDVSKIDLIFGDSQTGTTTGYIIKKGKHYSSVMANDHSRGTSGGIVFRGAEALLIYMEASYEKNGNIDATADKYWRALRTRAKVDPDYNKTIAATDMMKEAEGDFGAYSHGQLIDATLYNIRRERRNELCAEALRWEDLKRWRALDQLKDTPFRPQGMLYWGSVYEEQMKDKCIVDPAKGNMSPESSGPYIYPYEKITVNNDIYKQGGFKFTPAHYLEPIGAAVFRQTAANADDFTSSNVYQNPGWSYEANTGAMNVE